MRVWGLLRTARGGALVGNSERALPAVLKLHRIRHALSPDLRAQVEEHARELVVAHEGVPPHGGDGAVRRVAPGWGFCVSGFGCGFWVLGFGFWVLGSGF